MQVSAAKRELAEEENIAIVMVTHEHAFAARAHRQISLRDGRVVTDTHAHVDGESGSSQRAAKPQ